MRPLQRPGRHGEVVHVVERAVVAESLLGPREPDDLQALVEARTVLRHRHAKAVELAGDGAAPHSELQPAAGEDVGGGGLLRAGERMVQREQGHGGPDAETARALSDGRHHHERVGQQREGAPEVDLRQPGGVEAQRLGQLGELEELLEALGMGPAGHLRRLEEETESHPCEHTTLTRAGAASPATR